MAHQVPVPAPFRAFGDRLRIWRQKARLTQATVAEALGCTQSFVSRLESGELLPSAQHLGRLRATFGVLPADLGLRVVEVYGVEQL